MRRLTPLAAAAIIVAIGALLYGWSVWGNAILAFRDGGETPNVAAANADTEESIDVAGEAGVAPEALATVADVVPDGAEAGLETLPEHTEAAAEALGSAALVADDAADATDAADLEPAGGPINDEIAVAEGEPVSQAEPAGPEALAHADADPGAVTADLECPLPDPGIGAPGDPACEAVADAATPDIEHVTPVSGAIEQVEGMSEPRQIAGPGEIAGAVEPTSAVGVAPQADVTEPTEADAEITVAHVSPDIVRDRVTEPEITPKPALQMRDQAVTNPIDAVAPTFDIVRVAPGGSAVIAGRAEPGSSVSVVDRDTVVGSAVADVRGEWVVISEQPLPPGPSEIGLVARSAGGVASQSEQVVVLMVPGVPAPAVATVADAPAELPVAVLMGRAGGGNAKLLQGGVPGGGLSAPGALRLETVSYDEAGDFDISGTAIPGNMIAGYLDNQPIGTTPVDTDGTWRLLPDKVIDPGLYTLRIDQIDKSGLVVSRLETPFSIADLTTASVAEGLVVVQPGNSLWRIARRIYGKGIQHTVIYQANADQIRDPDLIYPGQIFIVPGERSDG